MGILYTRPDGQLLAHLPGDQRDEAFERHLHRQDVPFIVHRHDELEDAPAMTGGGAGGAPAHVRTTWERQKDGSLARKFHLHHGNGDRGLELDQEADHSNA